MKYKIILLLTLLFSYPPQSFADEGWCWMCEQWCDEVSDCCHACQDCIWSHGAHCILCESCFIEDQNFCDDPSHFDLDWEAHCDDCSVKCESCGLCFLLDPDDFCEECYHCFACARDEELHCVKCMEEENGFDMADIECDNCRLCRDCIEDAASHCPECDDCYADYPEELCEVCGLCPGCQQHCPECGECLENGIDVCYDCNMCIECAVDQGLHCINCCDDTHSECEECQLCMDCAIDEGLHCPMCYEHTMEDEPCPSEGEHCAQCCASNDWLCPECDRCTEGDGISLCRTCQMCEFCCKCFEKQYYTKTFDHGDYTFGYDDNGTWVVLVDYHGTATTVEIPSYVNHGDRRYRVRIIGTGAFRDNNIIRKVTVPACVDQIDKGAFARTRITDLWLYPSYTQGIFTDILDGNTSLSHIYVPQKYLAAYKEQLVKLQSKIYGVNHMVEVGGFYWSVDDATHTATLERGDEGMKEYTPDPLIVPSSIRAYGRNYIVTRIGSDALPTYCVDPHEQKDVVLPATLKTMAETAFGGPDERMMTSYLWLNATTPPAFDHFDSPYDFIAGLTYVPYGTEEIYMNHEQWNDHIESISVLPICVDNVWFSTTHDEETGEPVFFMVDPIGGYPATTTDIHVPATLRYKGETYKVAQTGYPRSGALISSGALIDNSNVVNFVNDGSTTFGRFRNCPKLETITFNGELTRGEDIRNCPKLKTIRLTNIKPISLLYGDFDPSKVTLQVPKQSVDAYKASASWNKFKIEGYTLGSESGVEIEGLSYDINGDTRKATLVGGAGGKLPSQVIVPANVSYKGISYEVTAIAKGALVSTDVKELRLCRTSVPTLASACINVPNADLCFPAGSSEQYLSALSMYGAKYRRFWLWGDDTTVPKGYVLSNDGDWDDCVRVVSSNIDGSYAGWRGDIIIPDEIYYEPDDDTYTVDEIPARAFYNNRMITSVSLGRNIARIKLNAFQFCSNLKTIYVRRSNFAPTINTEGVENHGVAEFLPNGVIVYVPKGSTSTVKNKWTLWNSNIKEYREMSFGGKYSGDVDSDDALTPADATELFPMLLTASPLTLPNRAADVNRDGKISAEDLSTLYYYMHNYTFKEYTDDPEEVQYKSGNELKLALAERTDGEYTFRIELNNASTPISHVSFFIRVPEGAEITSALADPSRSVGHTLTYARVKADLPYHNKPGFIDYFVSLDNGSSLTPFQHNSGSVATFTIKCHKALGESSHLASLVNALGLSVSNGGNGSATFYKMATNSCVFSTNGFTYEGEEDGIRSTTATGKHKHTSRYNLSGRVQKHKAEHGEIYIEKGKKVIE